MWRRLDIVLNDVPPKRRLTLYLHGASCQKIAFIIVTAVKTPNLFSVFTLEFNIICDNWFG
jgi:hypothetical protein